MDNNIESSNFEKDINPILTNLLSSKITPEKLPEIQNLISNINKKYTQSDVGNQFYKIYYAQALIDYLNYSDNLAKESLAYAKEIYGGEFNGYHSLYASLNPVIQPPKIDKAEETFGFILIAFSLLSLGGWLLNSGNPSEETSIRIGSFIFPLILLVVGIFLYSDSKK